MTNKLITVCDMCDGPKDTRHTVTSDETSKGWMKITILEMINETTPRTTTFDVCPKHAKAFHPFIKRHGR